MHIITPCQGIYPDGSPCPRKAECLRYTESPGDEWIALLVEGGYCFDRVTRYTPLQVKGAELQKQPRK